MLLCIETPSISAETDGVMLRLQGSALVPVLAVPLRPRMKGLPDGKSVNYRAKADGLVELSARFVRLVDGKRFVSTMPHMGEPLMAPSPTSKLWDYHASDPAFSRPPKNLRARDSSLKKESSLKRSLLLL